jgi:hypothetical protein
MQAFFDAAPPRSNPASRVFRYPHSFFSGSRNYLSGLRAAALRAQSGRPLLFPPGGVCPRRPGSVPAVRRLSPMGTDPRRSAAGRPARRGQTPPVIAHRTFVPPNYQTNAFDKTIPIVYTTLHGR